MDVNTPALQPPPGVVPNFDDPPNRNIEAHIGISICVFIVFTGVSLRAYSRIFCMRQVHLEDLFPKAPYVAFVCGVYHLMQTTGIYVHQWNIRASTVPSALFIVYVNTSLFQATMGSVKTAILLEWTRIFVPPGTRTTFWWTCQITMWVNILYYSTVVIVSAISCNPHEKIWNPSLPGTCLQTKPFFISNATLNLVSDIIIFVLPQRVIWKLKMSRQQKTGVSVVFAVGLIASLVGVGRLTRGVMYYVSDDNLYHVSGIFLWCTAELSVAYLVFCLPAIPKIFSSDNRINKPTTRLYSWFSFKKTHSADIARTDKIISTQDASVLSIDPTWQATWGSEYDQRHSRVVSHLKVDTYAPDTRSIQDPYAHETWHCDWSYHDPETSWYEESRQNL
ncbi:hypothetical protein F5Y14DRAFT_439754 [Nemania sp. NC0429]|nr:hypothetical protein F5Y14DRAFT_439754 [Nemania sp. NC0429]